MIVGASLTPCNLQCVMFMSCLSATLYNPGFFMQERGGSYVWISAFSLVPENHTEFQDIIDIRGNILNVYKLTYGHCFCCGISVYKLAFVEFRTFFKSLPIRPNKVQVEINIWRHIASHIIIECFFIYAFIESIASCG